MYTVQSPSFHLMFIWYLFLTNTLQLIMAKKKTAKKAKAVADFKKTKKKVGRIQKSEDTKLTITTRKINVPTQHNDKTGSLLYKGKSFTVSCVSSVKAVALTVVYALCYTLCYALCHTLCYTLCYAQGYILSADLNRISLLGANSWDKAH